MSTLKDIAEKCGVATSTVSTAINHPHKISYEVREKILAAARELNYFVKKEQKISRIMLIADNYKNYYYGEFYSDVIFGIQKRLSELKLDLRIANDFDVNFSDVYDYDGMIFLGRTPNEYLKKAVKFHTPIVLAGHPNPEFNVPAIYQKTAAGVEQLTEYLISCGHKKIALITGETNPKDIIWHDFISAYKKVLLKYNLNFSVKNQFQADYSDVQTIEIAFNKILSLKPKVTAIFCSNDLIAYYVYKAANKYNIEIPQDISVVGFDDITFPRYLDKPKPVLTTAYSDKVNIGSRAVELLIKAIKEPQKIEQNNLEPMQISIGRSVKRI